MPIHNFAVFLAKFSFGCRSVFTVQANVNVTYAVNIQYHNETHLLYAILCASLKIMSPTGTRRTGCRSNAMQKRLGCFDWRFPGSNASIFIAAASTILTRNDGSLSGDYRGLNYTNYWMAHFRIQAKVLGIYMIRRVTAPPCRINTISCFQFQPKLDCITTPKLRILNIQIYEYTCSTVNGLFFIVLRWTAKKKQKICGRKTAFFRVFCMWLMGALHFILWAPDRRAIIPCEVLHKSAGQIGIWWCAYTQIAWPEQASDTHSAGCCCC